MAIKEIKQNSFLSGMINDPRSTNPQGFWYSENLEVGKRRSVKQVVNNQAENVCGFEPTWVITKMIENNGNLYGLGQIDDTNSYAAIFTKTAALTGNWAIPTNGGTTNAVISRDDPFFACDGTTLYFVNGGYLGKYVIGTNTMTANWGSIPESGTRGFKGGLSWNGKFYGWYDNVLCEVNISTGAISPISLAIGGEQYIKSVVPFEGNLMIICDSQSTLSKSKAYLYNGANITAYEIGSGTVISGAYLEGMLFVAMAAKNKRYFSFLYFNGVNFKVYSTFTAKENLAGTYAYISPASQMRVYGNYIYFIATGTKSSSSYAGYYEYFLMRFGREDSNNNLALSVYKTFDFVNVARGVDGQVENNCFLILESISGGVSAGDRSVAATIYTDTEKSTFFLSSASTYSAQAGVLETFRFNGGDPSIENTWQAVAAFYAPLPANASVTLKYRKNEDTAWTTIFTDSTANSCGHAAVNIENGGANLPIFNEVQLRIELLGNAEFLGYKFKYEPLEQNNY